MRKAFLILFLLYLDHVGFFFLQYLPKAAFSHTLSREGGFHKHID